MSDTTHTNPAPGPAWVAVDASTEHEDPRWAVAVMGDTEEAVRAWCREALSDIADEEDIREDEDGVWATVDGDDGVGFWVGRVSRA